MKKLLIISALLIGKFLPSSAATEMPADTMRLSISQAEQLFQERNLPLLMQKSSIEAAKASVMQAKLFENPVLGIEQGARNPERKKYFETGRYGQNIVTLEQLVYLGGKRSKRVKAEDLNRQLTELEYYDLLRNLRFNLRTSFVQLHFQVQMYRQLNQRTQVVQHLVKALDGQYRKGNVPLKEITRLQALLFALENQKLSLQSEIQQRQADLRILTQIPATSFILPQVEETSLQTAGLGNMTYSQLLAEAQQNRIDLKAAATQVQLQEANLQYQKALAVPDITVGGVYDKAGSYINNYTGLTVQMPLPLWNRNQGNIKIARHEIDRSKLQLQQQNLTLENEVMQAYQKARTAETLASNFDPDFHTNFEKLIEGVTSSFARRNISLIEFLDYYETYTESLEQTLELKNNRLRALEEINFAVGKPLINY